MRNRNGSAAQANERGATLVFVGLGLAVLLGVMALAIDLGMLYVSRSEAQRAADAAALAGANQFLEEGCTTASGGCVAGGAQEGDASAQAIAVAAQNYVAGKPASVTDSDITFSYPSSEEPQITVLVQATVPTFFAKIFGVTSATVDAKATAEAYNPSGNASKTNISVGCVVPFLVPNCDPDHTSPANSVCDTGSPAGYFFDPSTGAVDHPGAYSAGGIVGENWQLHTESGPSQWFLIAFTGQSGADLRTYIEQCSPTPISCGDSIETMNGKKVGPTEQGVEARINASGLGPAQAVYPATGQPNQNGCSSFTSGCAEGQDVINILSGPPFEIMGGTNNPNPALVGQTFYGPSQSIVVAPVYNGNDALPPGGTAVSVVGYLQLFITDVEHSGKDVPVDAIVMGAYGCGGPPSGSGGLGSGTGTGSVDTAGSPIPIRLIRTQ